MAELPTGSANPLGLRPNAADPRTVRRDRTGTLSPKGRTHFRRPPQNDVASRHVLALLTNMC